MNQILFTLQCLRTIWLNAVTIIEKHKEVYAVFKRWSSINNAYLTIDNSESFKYKVVLVGKTAHAVNNKGSSVKNTKIVVPLSIWVFSEDHKKWH